MYNIDVSVKEIEYHRNGISGNGFHVIKFNCKEDGKNLHMVGILFEEQGSCAVFDQDLLGQGNIKFGENSWRGDVYEDKLRKAIKDMYDEQDRKYALEHPKNHPTLEDMLDSITEDNKPTANNFGAPVGKEIIE